MSGGGIIVLAVGAAGIAWFVLRNRATGATAAAASQWPVTAGIVTLSEMRFRTPETRVIRRYYVPTVHYSYSVAGQAYEGSRISFGSVESTTASVSEAMLAAFPLGAAVQVRYDPQNPASSVLQPPGNGST